MEKNNIIPTTPPLDVVGQTELALGALGYRFNEFWEFIKNDTYGTPMKIPPEAVSLEIFMYKTKENLIGLSTTLINSALEYIIFKKQAQQFADIRHKTNFDPSATNKGLDIVNAFTGIDHNKIYDTIFNHVLWCIKRRMRGMSVDYPIWVNFSGKDSIGKTWCLRTWMEGIIPTTYIEAPSGKTSDGNIINNIEKNGYLFAERYAIIFGELAGMSDVGIAQVKDIIDQPVINYRVMHTQTSARGRNTAQLLSSSNTHIRDNFQRDDYIRKYCDILFADGTPEELKSRWKIIDNFDYIEWMRSIDENGPSPLSAIYQEYLKWVKEDCYSPTESDIWMSGYVFTHSGKTILRKHIVGLYNKCPIKNKISNRSKFAILFKRFNLVESKLRRSGGTAYFIPGGSIPLEGYEQYFDIDIISSTNYQDKTYRDALLEDKGILDNAEEVECQHIVSKAEAAITDPNELLDFKPKSAIIMATVNDFVTSHEGVVSKELMEVMKEIQKDYTTGKL